MQPVSQPRATTQLNGPAAMGPASMDPAQKSSGVDAANTGLDRVPIGQDGRIQLPDQHSDEAKFDESGSTSSSSHTTLTSIREKRHEVADKIKEKLHIGRSSDEKSSNTQPGPILAKTENEKSDSRLLNDGPVHEKKTLKDLTHHPVSTVKDKVSSQGNHQVAANIAAKEIPHGQEVDLVNAESKVNAAQTELERILAIEDLEKLIKERQAMYVRWTLDRHVTKLRELPGPETVPWKTRADFERKHPQEGIVMDWRGYFQHLLKYYAQQYGGQYIGYGSDPPTPSKETIMPNVERLLVATSPFQEFIMTTRRVYRWEDRAETTKYLAIYMTLWYFNLLLPGIISAFIYLVVERRVHGNNLKDLRADIIHREDVNRTALSLTEYIEKKGDEEWADDLLQGLGPWLMVQLADAANFFESIRNFYEWRVPQQTTIVLALMASAIPITIFVPLWLLVKSMTFGFGFVFFGLFPIATNFPDYRLLVSPLKIMFWNIPTHAEWAIKYIQAEGQRYLSQKHINPSSTVSTSTDTAGTSVPTDISSHPSASADISPSHAATTSSSPALNSRSSSHEPVLATYTVSLSSTKGTLTLTPTTITFAPRNSSTHTHFTLPYTQIKNLEKQDRIVEKNLPNKLKLKNDDGQDLRIVGRNRLGGLQEWVLSDVERRDECFSQIVGWSGREWQVVW